MRGRPVGSTNHDYTKYDPNVNDTENANKIGVTRDSVIKWRHSNGLPVYNRADSIDMDEFYRLYNMGYTDARIAFELGKTNMGVFFYRKRHGIPTNHPRTVRQPPITNVTILTYSDESWKDPESLFCDVDFLEKFKKGVFENENI